MTKLLDKAIAAVQELPPEKQDAIASLILEELADDLKWDVVFTQSQHTLAELAAKARADMQAGRITNTGFDEL
ncbi:MAG: hypothetical protein AAGF95_33250 [Chloroflexota bacterium]